jgi:hypothetical protein
MISVGAGLLAQLTNELGAQPVLLLDLDFTTGHRRFAVWTHAVVYSGNTYLAMPPIDDVDAIESAQQTPLTEGSIRFAVQNDPLLLADLSQNCRDRWADAYMVSLVNGVPVDGEAIHLWRRRMVPGPTFADATQDYVDLGLESRFNRSRNRAPRTYSHAWQQDERDATDFAFYNSGKGFDIGRPDWVQKSGLKS